MNQTNHIRRRLWFDFDFLGYDVKILATSHVWDIVWYSHVLYTGGL